MMTLKGLGSEDILRWKVNIIVTTMAVVGKSYNNSLPPSLQLYLLQPASMNKQTYLEALA